MLEDDGYGKLGLYSNAIIYLGIALGSIVSTGVMNKIGEVHSIVVGSFMCIPFMASFIFASMKTEQPELSGFCFTPFFIYTSLMVFSFIHGLG